MNSTGSPNDDVLEFLRLLFLRGQNGSDSVKRLASFPENVWRLSLGTAASEGMDGYAYLQLQRKGLHHHLPGRLREKLAHDLQRRAILSDVQLQALQPLIQSLSVVSIPCLILKSAAWQMTGLYPHPGFRSVFDVDLWVPPQEASRARKILSDLGYTPSWEIGDFSAKYFFQGESFLRLDLHTGVWLHFAEGLLSFEECWRNRRKVDWNGCPCFVLAPTHALVNRVFHDACSFNLFDSTLKGCLDAVLLVERFDREIRWDHLERIFTTPEMQLAVWLYLSTCDEFFGLPLERGKKWLSQLGARLGNRTDLFRKHYSRLKRALPGKYCYLKWASLRVKVRSARPSDLLREGLQAVWEEVVRYRREALELPDHFFEALPLGKRIPRPMISCLRFVHFTKLIPQFFLLPLAVFWNGAFQGKPLGSSHYHFWNLS